MKAALRVIIFVLVMGTVSAGLLVGINAYTLPLIAKNEEFKLRSSVLDVLEIPYDKISLEVVFDKNVKEVKKDNRVFYTALDGSVAFKFSGPGLWGPINGIIALEKNLKTIRTIKITYQEETPGLGARIAEKDYLKQFKGKEALPALVFMPEGKSSKINEVDAITGATGSSRAFERVINDNLKKYTQSLKAN